jgi:hypothetical protein
MGVCQRLYSDWTVEYTGKASAMIDLEMMVTGSESTNLLFFDVRHRAAPSI